jgi:hypothetical protein
MHSESKLENHQVELSEYFRFNHNYNKYESVLPKQTLLLIANYKTKKLVFEYC